MSHWHENMIFVVLSNRLSLQASLSVAQHHRAAVKAWASSAAGSSSVRQVPLGQTYHADPLNLSPLSHMPYLFVACARRMLADSSSEAGTEVWLLLADCCMH
jgi:hypothetical protein